MQRVLYCSYIALSTTSSLLQWEKKKTVPGASCALCSKEWTNSSWDSTSSEETICKGPYPPLHSTLDCLFRNSVGCMSHKDSTTRVPRANEGLHGPSLGCAGLRERFLPWGFLCPFSVAVAVLLMVSVVAPWHAPSLVSFFISLLFLHVVLQSCGWGARR